MKHLEKRGRENLILTPKSKLKKDELIMYFLSIINFLVQLPHCTPDTHTTHLLGALPSTAETTCHTVQSYSTPNAHMQSTVAYLFSVLPRENVLLRLQSVTERVTMQKFTTPVCAGDFKRRLPRTPSTGTMSSADDLDEREPPSPSDNGKLVHVCDRFMCALLRHANVYTNFGLVYHHLCDRGLEEGRVNPLETSTHFIQCFFFMGQALW